MLISPADWAAMAAIERVEINRIDGTIDTFSVVFAGICGPNLMEGTE
jgi:hypothetical protein